MSYLLIERRVPIDNHDRLLMRHPTIRNLYTHDTRKPTRDSLLAILEYGIHRDVQRYWKKFDAVIQPRQRRGQA